MTSFVRLHLTLPIMLCWWFAMCQCWPAAAFNHQLAETNRISNQELHKSHGHDKSSPKISPAEEEESEEEEDESESTEEESDEEEDKKTPASKVAAATSDGRSNLEATEEPTYVYGTVQKVALKPVDEQQTKSHPEPEVSTDANSSATAITDERLAVFSVEDDDQNNKDLQEKLHKAIDGISSDNLNDDIRGIIKGVLDKVIKPDQPEDNEGNKTTQEQASE